MDMGSNEHTGALGRDAHFASLAKDDRASQIATATVKHGRLAGRL